MKKKYPIYCAWCDKNKGKKTIVGETTVPGSAGICRDCDEELRREAGLPPKRNSPKETF